MSNKLLLKNKKWLEQKYIVENLSATQIGKICGATKFTVLRYLRKSSIIVRKITNIFPPLHNEAFFDRIDTEEKAYWLGFIFADGNIHKNRYNVQINLSAKDEQHLVKLAHIFNHKIIHYKRWDKKKQRMYFGVTLALSSKHLWQSLFNLGVKPNKTDNETGEVVPKISESMLPHFIRGYFDGDGSVSFSKRKSHILGNFSLAGHPLFLQKIRNVIIDKTDISFGELVEFNRYSVLRWGGQEQMRKIYNYLYFTFSVYLERKQIKFAKGTEIIKVRRGSSGFRGISWHKTNKKWLASISHDGKRLNLGYYQNSEEAARAYDEAVYKFHKPLYRLNFEKKVVV